MKKSCLLLLLLTIFSGSLFSQIPGEGKSVSFNGAKAVVVFSASTNSVYEVQRSTNLTSWVTLISTNVPVTGLFQITDAFLDLNAVPTRAFYRLRQPGPATVLVVSGFPSPQTAGVAGTVTVQARDTAGSTAVNYRGTVHFTSNDGAAILPANYTFTAADAGVHTFTSGVTLKTAGTTRSVTATDTATSSITGVQSGITINPAATAVLVVAGFPTPRTAGVAGTVTVTAKDSFGNTATGYRGTVHFTSSDGAATLPVNYTFTAGDNGAHTFSSGVTLKTAGTQSITATDTVTGSLTASQSAITIVPAAAAVLVVSGFPDPVTGGDTGNVTVTAKDAFGNTATGYRGTVHFTSSDGVATLPVNYTFTAGDAGLHVFPVILESPGFQSITATDAATGTITGSQINITVFGPT